MGGAADAEVRQQLDVLALVGAAGVLSDGELLGRFLTRSGESSQAAFTALVDRHGPMVLRVCRQSIGNSHDVQDAFQATFLILARKAGSVRAESMACWLYGVARKVSARAKADAIRRKALERRASENRLEGGGFDTLDSEPWSELHEEIAKLPRHYREPIVLCYVEGISTDAAAARLACPRGTILSRLSRARERLRARLTLRGLAPKSVLPMAGPSWPLGRQALPAGLLRETVRESIRFSNPTATLTALTSTKAASMAMKVLWSMTVSNLKVVGTALIACVVIIGGAQSFAFQTKRAAEGVAGPVTKEAQMMADLVITVDMIAAELKESARRNGELQEEIRQIRANFDQPRIARSPTGSGDLKIANSPESESDKGRVVVSGDQSTIVPSQPTLRVGGFIIAASISGDQVIAYKPQSGEKLLANLQVLKGETLKVTPVGKSGVVGLNLEGKRISRIAAFDVKGGKWFVQDLVEPVSGSIKPTYVGSFEVAYDVGSHSYTFNTKLSKWDHFNSKSIGN